MRWLFGQRSSTCNPQKKRRRGLQVKEEEEFKKTKTLYQRKNVELNFSKQVPG